MRPEWCLLVRYVKSVIPNLYPKALALSPDQIQMAKGARVGDIENNLLYRSEVMTGLSRLVS